MNPKASENPEGFFRQKRSEWAHVKHVILENYLRVFIYKLQRTSKTITVVDGFAGAGGYEDGSAGSPVIAAKLNDDPLVRERGVAVQVIAVEAEEENLKSLDLALRPWTEGSRCAWILPGRFETHVEQIAAMTSSNPTFVFLDPFGMKALSVDQIAPLLAPREHAPMELLLRVSATLLSRFAGQVRAGISNPLRAETAKAFANLLERMGIQPELAVTAHDRLSSAEGRRTEMLRLYAEVFEGRFPYIQYIPVKASYRAAPKYYLMHASSSAHGYVLMNDISAKFSDVQEAAHHQRRHDESLQADMFGVTPVTRVSQDAIKRVLLASIRDVGNAPSNFIEHRVVLVDAFGDTANARDHNAALRSLEIEGLVHVTRRSTKNLDNAVVSAG